MPDKIEQTVYHKNGSVWAKGSMIGETPNGYWEWYRVDGIMMIRVLQRGKTGWGVDDLR